MRHLGSGESTRWRRSGPARAATLGLLLVLGSARPTVAQPIPAEAPPDDRSDPATGGPANDGGEAPVAPAIEPPRILASPPPAYPDSELAEGREPSVILHVVLDAQGQVQAAHVDHAAGEAFDAAALAAIRTWRFAPATRDGVGIGASVHVAVHFRLPQFDLQARGDGEVLPETTAEGERFGPEPFQDVPASGSDMATQARAQAQDQDQVEAQTPEYGAEAAVELAPAREPTRSASDVEIGREVIAAAPHSEGAEVLRTAPGLYIGRAEGEAVGHRFMLRGFDADHGQDLALSVSGMPVNLPSHIHGQGYADLGFLIGDTVAALDVKEGVYDPAQGDFAVAGSIDARLGVRDRGLRLQAGYGSFQRFQALALWAPPEERDGTFAAARLGGTDGFGQQRFARSGSLIAQSETLHGHWTLRATGILHGARADLAGVLRADDIAAGRVDYYDAYDLPTARAQNALNTRALLGATAEYRGGGGDNGALGLWLSYDDFRLQENFTGFTQRSTRLAGVAGRGDLIEQQNRTASVGVHARYRTAPWQPFSWLAARVEAGAQGRVDAIGQSQRLLDANRNQTWDERVDADVRQTDVGLWADAQADAGEQLTARVGVRGDLLLFDVDDRLQNRIPLTRPDGFIEGYRRTAAGLAMGPRASVTYRPLPWLHLLGAYGEGYRSPQARSLEDGERAPFTKVRSADAGMRFLFEPQLDVRVIGYWTRLSDDIAFDASEGRLERIGASRRLGGVLHVASRPLPWLVASGSLTYVDAELLEPPPPSASDPQPAFEGGQNLPYVPPLVARVDLGAHTSLAQLLAGQRVRLRAGMGASFLSSRPLPHGAFADPFGLLDASMAAGLGPLTLSLELFNLLDAQYAAVEYNFVSQWQPDAATSRLPARHIAAGAPRTFMLTLEAQL